MTEINEIIHIIWICLVYACGIYGAAVAVAKITPTQKDDNFLEKFRKVFEFIEKIVPNLVQTKTGKIKKQ